MGFYNPNLIQIPVEKFSFTNQSDEIDATEGVRCSKWREIVDDNAVKTFEGKCSTLYEAFRLGAGKSHGGPCLGWRPSVFSPYSWMTYDEVLTRAKNFGSGLLCMGLSTGVHTMVGIYCRQMKEYYFHQLIKILTYDNL